MAAPKPKPAPSPTSVNQIKILRATKMNIPTDAEGNSLKYTNKDLTFYK